ncbi:MAG: DNA repair protein RecO, partial [Gammaproteobacteria bacterium]
MRAAERVMLTPAYVLHQHDWRETSRVVEILSRDHGRLGVVARGARRAKSPWRALLRPFQPLLVSWMGGGELMTLFGAEPSAASHPLSGRALLSGFYMNELLLRLLPRQDPHPALFNQYADVLGRLMQDTSPA